MKLTEAALKGFELGESVTARAANDMLAIRNMEVDYLRERIAHLERQALHDAKTIEKLETKLRENV